MREQSSEVKPSRKNKTDEDGSRAVTSHSLTVTERDRTDRDRHGRCMSHNDHHCAQNERGIKQRVTCPFKLMQLPLPCTKMWGGGGICRRSRWERMGEKGTSDTTSTYPFTCLFICFQFNMLHAHS